jgi:DNA-binding transcriptional regulator YiaG
LAQEASMTRLILNDLDVETAEKLARRATRLGTTPEEEASRLLRDRLCDEPREEPAATGADPGASDPRFVRQHGFLAFTGVIATEEIPDHRALREERVDALLKGASGRHRVEEEMSKCVECGKEMETRYEDRALDGLPEVTIADLAVEHCPACGATEEVWPALEPMYRALAAAIIAKPHRLTGAEIRVLRNVLGWTAVELAALLGVSSSQVSRWENDREPVGPVADRMVRAILALREGMSLSTDRLAAIGTERRHLRATLRYARGCWKVETEDMPPVRAAGAG